MFQNFRVIYCSGSYPLKDGYFFIFSFGKLCISENSNSLQGTKDNLSRKGMLCFVFSSPMSKVVFDKNKVISMPLLQTDVARLTRFVGPKREH